MLFFAVWPAQVRAQGIQVDATSLSTGSDDTFDDCWAHTVGTGSNRLLIVGVSNQDVADSVNSVTWYPTATNCTGSSQALTQVGSRANSSNANAEIWRLVNPTAGSGSINVNFIDAQKTRSGAVSFFNVDQTTPVGTFTSAIGGDDTPTVTVTGVAEGEVVVDTVAAKGGVTLTVGAGQTERWNGVVTDEMSAGGSTEPGPDGGGGVTMSWSLSEEIEWAIGAVAIKPVNATLVELSSFTASEEKEGVLLEWRTGFEVDNLGFHLYQEEGGRKVRITPELIGGSAFLVAQGTPLTAGHSYRWWDREGSASARYWLEDIDLDGERTWHGPVQAERKTGDRSVLLSRAQSELPSSPLLSQLGQSHKGKQVLVKSGAAWSPLLQSTASAEERRQKQWELASEPAVKLEVREIGWYRVGQPELVAAGLSPGVNPRFLQLFMEGEEQAIWVPGERDDRFDLWDAIEFYATGADTPWSDTHTYWLVEGGEPGQRMAAVLGTIGLLPGPESFSFAVERKERTIYVAAVKNGETENFFGPMVTSQPVEQSIPLHHFDRSQGDAHLEVSLQGMTRVSHRVRILLNGTELGAVSFSGQEGKTTSFAVPENLLEDTVVTLRAEGGETDVSLLDAIRLTYAHTYEADADSLEFTVPGEEAAAQGGTGPLAFPTLGGKRVTVGGFSSPLIRVADVTDPKQPRLLAGVLGWQAGRFTITLTAPGAGTRKLLALVEGQAKSPAAIQANNPSQWNQADSGAEVLILTHRDFVSNLEPLKTFRESQGYTVAVIDVEDIYDEFGFGSKTPWALRDFLTWAGTQWSIAPRFVLLVGDASFDPRDYLGLGNFDFVPTRLMETTFLETASDDWFADFDLDGVPELAVGRLPVRTAQDADRLVAKIVAYEQGQDGPWKQKVLMAVDENDPTYDFEQDILEVEASLPAGLMVEKILRGQSGATAKAELLTKLNEGQLLVNYLGHGSVEVWNGDLLTSDDAQALTNGSRLPFFVNLTCLNGFFHDLYTGSLAEALLNAEQGGAVAVWTSSGLTAPQGQLVLAQEMLRLLFGDEGLTLGEAVARAKAAVNDPDVRRTWIFFGDPATSLP